MEKVLMSLKEVCEYTGWGETKVREILKRPTSKFTVILGNRLYVNKKSLMTIQSNAQNIRKR